jgi:repressor LexA
MTPATTPAPLTERQAQVLEFVDTEIRRRGYPPSVREIGEAVGLSSSSTVHAHLAALQDKGYLRRDPTEPRAIEVCFEPGSGAVVDRRPVRHVPLVGDVAAGTGVLAAENIEETLPLPEDFTGDGQLFMLRVRGDSMIEAGILDRDYVVVRQQPTAENGDVVVAGIPGEEATVKTFLRRRYVAPEARAGPPLRPVARGGATSVRRGRRGVPGSRPGRGASGIGVVMTAAMCCSDLR